MKLQRHTSQSEYEEESARRARVVAYSAHRRPPLLTLHLMRNSPACILHMSRTSFRRWSKLMSAPTRNRRVCSPK